MPWLGKRAAVAALGLLALLPSPAIGFYPQYVQHGPRTRGNAVRTWLPLALPEKVGARAPAAVLLAEGLGTRRQQSMSPSPARGTFRVHHVNGSAIKDEDYSMLRDLVSKGDVDGVRGEAGGVVRTR